MQAPAPAVRRDDGRFDLDATIDGAGPLVDAGVTDVTITVRLYARDGDDAAAVARRAADRFRAAVP